MARLKEDAVNGKIVSCRTSGLEPPNLKALREINKWGF